MVSESEPMIVPAPAPRRSRARRLWSAVARRMGEIAIVTAGILIAFALATPSANHAPTA